MKVAQLCEQFDVDWSRPFGTIEEAEQICSGLSGFLVEVSQPFVDPQGTHREPGVLFAKGLR